jgi:putative ABC transport system permease protein
MMIPRQYTPRSSTVWLALLTLCVIFAATAGVREALATRTNALRQTLAAAPALSSTIQVSGQMPAIMGALEPNTPPGLIPLSEPQSSEMQGELHQDLNHGVVHLAPGSADWTALTTSQLITLKPVPPQADGFPVKLEITYRDPIRSHVRLVSGAFPAPPAQANDAPPAVPGRKQQAQAPYPVVQILVTEQTAARLGLKTGSRVVLPGPYDSDLAQPTSVTLVVSGIVMPVALNSAFWTSDLAAAVPDLETTGGGGLPSSQQWVAGLITVPGESAALQGDFGSDAINAQWTYPLDLSEVTGAQSQALNTTLSSLSSRSLPLSGDLEPAAPQLTAASGLPSVLAPFVAAAQSADVLLWLLYVSLTVAGLVVLLLAGRMVVLRRSGELALIRARGASLWRLGGIIGGEAALLCVPAAVIAVALGIAAVPGAGGLAPVGAAGAWWPVVAVLLVAVCGPALIAVWQHRSRRRRAPGRRQRTRVRPMVEVTLILASVAGIVVFRQQGLQAGSGVNLYTSAAPVLIAVPAVIVVFRLYPLVLRWLLRIATRTSGAPAFLGLARAARTALTPALPAFALVLALSVVAFGGMVRDAVTNGEVAASWAAVGADAAITPSSVAPGFTIPAATARAIASVPGVTHAAQVWETPWFTSSGTQVAGLAVDPAEYAALVAATQGFPAVPAAALATPTSPDAPQPVLASPSAAAALGTSPVTLSTQAAVHPVNIRIVGTLSSTPALGAGTGLSSTVADVGSSAFVIMPFAAMKSSATPPAPVTANEMLLTGAGIDRAQVAAALQKGTAGGDVTYRADVLAGLSDAPLQHGAVTVITLSVIAAAVLGLAVMLLELALGTAERDATLARLATMGLREGQRARVVALELLPAVLAAAVAAWACALVLPPVVRPVLDLSVFTGSSAAVPLVPDVASVALPLAGLLVLAAVALGIEIRSGQRRGVTTALRVGG